MGGREEGGGGGPVWGEGVWIRRQDRMYRKGRGVGVKALGSRGKIVVFFFVYVCGVWGWQGVGMVGGWVGGLFGGGGGEGGECGWVGGGFGWFAVVDEGVGGWGWGEGGGRSVVFPGVSRIFRLRRMGFQVGCRWWLGGVGWGVERGGGRVAPGAGGVGGARGWGDLCY